MWYLYIDVFNTGWITLEKLPLISAKRSPYKHSLYIQVVCEIWIRSSVHWYHHHAGSWTCYNCTKVNHPEGLWCPTVWTAVLQYKFHWNVCACVHKPTTALNRKHPPLSCISQLVTFNVWMSPIIYLHSGPSISGYLSFRTLSPSCYQSLTQNKYTSCTCRNYYLNVSLKFLPLTKSHFSYVGTKLWHQVRLTI